jgi:hypothetical protein
MLVRRSEPDLSSSLVSGGRTLGYKALQLQAEHLLLLHSGNSQGNQVPDADAARQPPTMARKMAGEG